MTNGWKGAIVGVLAALGWAVALTVIAESEEVSRETAARVAQGRALAQAECGLCHATGSADESALAEALAFRDLSRLYPVEQLEEALAEGIVTGHEDMPEIVWDPDQIGAFVTYLKSLQTGESS